LLRAARKGTAQFLANLHPRDRNLPTRLALLPGA
jgi:hypothetical protein